MILSGVFGHEILQHQNVKLLGPNNTGVQDPLVPVATRTQYSHGYQDPIFPWLPGPNIPLVLTKSQEQVSLRRL